MMYFNNYLNIVHMEWLLCIGGISYIVFNATFNKISALSL
jgi:hypothetical protein